jgi:hypothetical protein
MERPVGGTHPVNPKHANGLYLKNIAWARTNGFNMLSTAPYVTPSKEMKYYYGACNVQKLWNGMSIIIEMDYQDKYERPTAEVITCFSAFTFFIITNPHAPLAFFVSYESPRPFRPATTMVTRPQTANAKI